jgi:hypothetical protein
MKTGAESSAYVGLKSGTALTTLATPFFLSQYAPELLLTRSAWTTALLLLSLEAVSYLVYTILIYPNYVSPLRYLPTPPVSFEILFIGRWCVVCELNHTKAANTLHATLQFRYIICPADATILTNYRAPPSTTVTLPESSKSPPEIPCSNGPTQSPMTV